MFSELLKVKWTDKVKNKKILKILRETPSLRINITKRRDLERYIMKFTGLIHTVTEGTVEDVNSRGRGRQILEYIKQIALKMGCRKCPEVKRSAQERGGWRVA